MNCDYCGAALTACCKHYCRRFTQAWTNEPDGGSTETLASAKVSALKTVKTLPKRPSCDGTAPGVRSSTSPGALQTFYEKSMVAQGMAATALDCARGHLTRTGMRDNLVMQLSWLLEEIQNLSSLIGNEIDLRPPPPDAAA